MKQKSTTLIISALIALLSLIGTALLYPYLPDEIPIHFNMAGQVDAYSTRNAIFLTGALPLIFTCLWPLIPKLDPRGDAYKQHQMAYKRFLAMIVLFFVILHWSMVAIAFGYPLAINRIIFSLVGILFVGIGNYMPQIRPNYTFGIRLPWTLDDVPNWRYTHRIGGYTFILGGTLILFANFLSPEVQSTVLLIVILGIVLIPCAASYYYYMKHARKK